MGEWADYWGPRVEYPCEKCGTPVVVVAVGDETLPAEAWSVGSLAFYCHGCFEAVASEGAL